jgi:hypothetical protein
LSAYLDGQLDADQRNRVNSALVSSPELAERLRGLTVVRDLVAGLNRESAVDVTPMVMSRIRSRRQSRSFAARLRHGYARRAAGLAGILAAAAGFLLVVTVAGFWQPRTHPVPTAPRVVFDNAIAESKTAGAGAAADDSVPAFALEPRSASSATADHRSVGAGARPSAVEPGAVAIDGGGPLAPGDLERSRGFLDNPHDRRFFLIKNGQDGKAQQRVASVVERTTRFGFYKITISHGIVIDPRHPEEATVFALLVNPQELDRLRDQLKVALSDQVEEGPADARIVTQLADIGQVQALAPSPLGDVSISRDALALKTNVGGGTETAALSVPAGARRPTAEQFHSAPVPVTARTNPGAETEHATDLAIADERHHAPEVPASPAHGVPPAAGIQPARARPEVAAARATPAQPEELVLVLVWICKSHAS